MFYSLNRFPKVYGNVKRGIERDSDSWFLCDVIAAILVDFNKRFLVGDRSSSLVSLFVISTNMAATSLLLYSLM
jgi:hypothetical protein